MAIAAICQETLEHNLRFLFPDIHIQMEERDVSIVNRNKEEKRGRNNTRSYALLIELYPSLIKQKIQLE